MNSPFSALAELAEAFIVLVRALVEDDERTAMTPRRIRDLAVECMPAGRHAALIVVNDGEARSIAATTDLPGQVDAIRLASQGPSLDVLDTNDLVVSNDLAADPRWPLFGSRVNELDIRSAASYRLYLSPTSPRRTELLLRLPHAFDDLAITSGAIVAAYCSLAMQSQLVLDEPVTHRRATEVHREIGVAVGILMATADLTTEAAYNRLHGASRNLQRSLSDVARQVIAHGPLIEPPDADRLSNH